MKIRVITYNIDGLPNELDLSTLPWVLKPIAWIYKMIKKTTIVKINDNSDTSEKIKNISKYISKSDANLVGVQEDFNYHEELMSSFAPGDFICGKCSNKFSLENLFSKIECWTYFPLPRFKSDGINLLMGKGASYNIDSEDIVPWKKSNGYISHANDLLTHKGFRYYQVNLKDDINLDVYIVHMDADFYDPINCPNVKKDIAARKSQFEQLIRYIANKYKEGHTNPIIIMGDTNSYDKYYWDVENVKYFINNLNYISGFNCKEAVPYNDTDCDRIFYINLDKANYELSLSLSMIDDSCNGLSDHKPLVVDFELSKK